MAGLEFQSDTKALIFITSKSLTSLNFIHKCTMILYLLLVSLQIYKDFVRIFLILKKKKKEKKRIKNQTTAHGEGRDRMTNQCQVGSMDTLIVPMFILPFLQIWTQPNLFWSTSPSIFIIEINASLIFFQIDIRAGGNIYMQFRARTVHLLQHINPRPEFDTNEQPMHQRYS